MKLKGPIPLKDRDNSSEWVETTSIKALRASTLMSQYPTEWHLDEAALDWLDQLLDKQYRAGVSSTDLSAHARAREMVDLWRAQMGSRRHQEDP